MPYRPLTAAVLTGLWLALAGVSHAADGGASAPSPHARFDVKRAQLQPSATQPSADGRYVLQARLHAAEDAPAPATGYQLKAALTTSALAACDATGSIFADSFE